MFKIIIIDSNKTTPLMGLVKRISISHDFNFFFCFHAVAI